MSDNETGHLRPDRDLNNLFTGVVRDMLDDEHGAVKSGANAALLDFLDNEAPDDVLEYHLNRGDYDGLDDLRDAVRQRQSADFPGNDDDGDA